MTSRSEPVFDAERLIATADYVFDRRPMPSEKLAVILWLSDFEAYRRTGRSITGVTWVKGLEAPYVRELGEDFFRRYVFSRCPRWAPALGYVFAVAMAFRYAAESIRG